ncbi:hypothetical protein GCM10027048_13700 [Hymenobacter coalescens]
MNYSALPSPLVQLRRSLAADVLKLKHTAALWLSVGSGVLPVVLAFCIYYFKGHELLRPEQDPWGVYLLKSWQTPAALLLPLFVVLLTSLVLGVENRANAWKHLYAQPIGRLSTFVSKLLIVLGLNALAQLLFLLLLIASGWVLGLLRPGLHFLDHAVPVGAAGRLLLHTYVATLGLLAVQYVAALWSRSFVTPVALGMGSIVTSLILLRWEHIDWVPYAAPLQAVRAGRLVGDALQVPLPLTSAEQLALGWFVGVLVAGYAALRYRHEGAAALPKRFRRAPSATILSGGNATQPV